MIQDLSFWNIIIISPCSIVVWSNPCRFWFESFWTIKLSEQFFNISMFYFEGGIELSMYFDGIGSLLLLSLVNTDLKCCIVLPSFLLSFTKWQAINTSTLSCFLNLMYFQNVFFYVFQSYYSVVDITTFRSLWTFRLHSFWKCL